MYKITPILKKRFKGYVESASKAKEDLEFLVENLGIKIDIDFSEKSLIDLEKIYWGYVNSQNFPEEYGKIEDFAELICRYLGQTIIFQTKANWVQTKEKNRRFGQPCIDGFGNEKWERIYPVSLANHFSELPKSNPTMPGVKEKKVMAELLKKAIRIYRRKK
jgi:hypothetical protein